MIQNSFCREVFLFLAMGGALFASHRGQCQLRTSLQSQVQPKGAAITLLIRKSSHELVVRQGGKRLRTYPVVLGGNPISDKLREGDNCTPEGTFRVRGKYTHRAWDRFLWLDYPTADSWRKHRAAKRAGMLKPTDRIGGQIGIHGVPAGRDHWIDDGSNWTLGCVSLKRADIEELYSVVKRGTVVKIVP